MLKLEPRLPKLVISVHSLGKKNYLSCSSSSSRSSNNDYYYNLKQHLNNTKAHSLSLKMGVGRVHTVVERSGTSSPRATVASK